MVKKILPLLLAAPCFAFAATCDDLSAYSVDGITFKEQTAGQAITQLLKSTPYSVSFQGAAPTGLVNAEDIAGSVSEVLSDLAAELELTYSISDCSVTIARKATRNFTVTQGQNLDIALGSWLKMNGYTLSWEAPQVLAGGSLSLSKSVEDILQDVVDLMKANGIAIEVKIYENNAIRVVEVK